MSGGNIERTSLHLDAAYLCVLRLAPEPYVRSILPNILAESAQVFRGDDPRLTRLAVLVEQAEVKDLTDYETNSIIAALQGAQSQAQYDQMRVRSFRNVISGVAALVTTLAVVLALVGLLRPQVLPLCFQPAGAVQQPLTPGQQLEELIACPSGNQRRPQPSDIPIVEFAGVLAATVAAAAALRRIRGTADPYSLPFALALLKLPTGALTAFLGLTMLHGGVIPGFGGLDSSGQIVAYAIAFGYSQELFTGLVDRQAQTVLAASAPTVPDSGATSRTALGQQQHAQE